MFETGLQYIRADFHLHTHKDKEFKYAGDQNSFVKDYIGGLKIAGIVLGVITNHNKFDKDEYVAIRKAAKKENIFILPGVELAIKEGANGIHTLIVFDPDEWLSNGENHIQSFLATAFASIPNPENANAKCNFDLKSTIEILDSYGRDYFLIFAHVDQNSGLFAECSGGLLHSLANIPSFRKRVLALQKAVEKKNIDIFFNIFKYRPALVEGSDPKSIADIGKGYRQTILKIGEFSFPAVKFALQDVDNRVFSAKPNEKHGYIESVSFQGGKFDGQTIILSPELNTLIGIRGSGKSAIIEIMRYTLGLSPQTDKEYKESLVQNILGSGGKSTLSVVNKHGKRYIISRIFGERVSVTDEEGNDLNITPTSIFDGVQYFGQKDLSNSADQENGLLEKLVSSRIGQQASISSCIQELREAVSQLLDANKIPGQIEDAKVTQSELNLKIQIFKDKGVAEKLNKQAAYTIDQTKVESAKCKIERVIKAINTTFEKNKEVSSALSDHESTYNPALIAEAKKILGLIDQQLTVVQNAIHQMQTLDATFSELLRKLMDDITSLSDEFAEIKREIKDDTLSADTFVQLTAEMTRTQELLNQLEEKGKARSSIEAAYRKAARQRNDNLHQQFHAYQAEINRINTSQEELRIEITFKGDREAFKARLKSDFRGSGISEIKYQTICESFTDYVDLIEDWVLSDGSVLRGILTPSEYTKLDAKLKEQFVDLLEYQVQNKVEIYYHNKLLKQHSIGQRASALILFILTQDNNDVIFIDQPEDDLDNKVIYEEVITAISKKKANIQFIFATHNANIPVLGDADRILVVDYQDTMIDVSQGNIDLRDTHKQIVDIMEGGKDAFEKRQLIYESWR